MPPKLSPEEKRQRARASYRRWRLNKIATDPDFLRRESLRTRVSVFIPAFLANEMPVACHIVVSIL